MALETAPWKIIVFEPEYGRSPSRPGILSNKANIGYFQNNN